VTERQLEGSGYPKTELRARIFCKRARRGRRQRRDFIDFIYAMIKLTAGRLSAA
jgi:hypothetical protein